VQIVEYNSELLTVPFDPQRMTRGKTEKLAKYSEDEARDEQGRWSSSGGSGENRQFLDIVAEDHGAKVDSSGVTGSFELKRDETFYRAEANPDRARRSGLKASLPPEVAEGADKEDHKALTGVYLTDKETATAYLNGRLDGKGEVIAVHLPEGTRIYQDPVDDEAIFVRESLPSHAVEGGRQMRVFKLSHGDARTIIHPGRLAPTSILAKHRLEKILANAFGKMRRKTVRALRREAGIAAKALLSKQRKFDSVQFNLDEADAKKVLAIAVDEQDWDPKGRDLEPHATVLFGFDGATFDQVEALTRGTGDCPAELGELFCFPAGDHGSPLVIRLKSPELVALHDRLSALPHTDTHDEYIPHVCVGYLKPEAAEKYVGKDYAGQGETIVLKDLIFSLRDKTRLSLEKALEYLKYSEDQARDENGRFASEEDSEGRAKTILYHGTTEEVAKKIFDEGLDASRAPGGTFATDSKLSALGYAKGGAKFEAIERGMSKEDRNNQLIGLVIIKDPEKAGFKYLQGAPGYYSSTSNVSPNFVDRVEFYRYGDISSSNPKPAKIISKNASKNSVEIYVPILLKESKTEKFTKALDDATQQILDSLAAEWEALAKAAVLPLTDASTAGADAGALQLDITGDDMLGRVNTVAREWAADRAAELVGMRFTDDGDLVPNPDARWAISDTTRERLRDAIARVFAEEQPTLKDIEDAIADAGIFDDNRATMIARTEVSRAQAQGNLDAWKTSGMVEEVNWVLSDDHDDDDICNENEEESPYALGEVPEFPAHPNCMCGLTLGRLKGEPEDAEKVLKYSDDEDRDENGRWTGGATHGTSVSAAKKIMKEGIKSGKVLGNGQLGSAYVSRDPVVALSFAKEAGMNEYTRLYPNARVAELDSKAKAALVVLKPGVENNWTQEPDRQIFRTEKTIPASKIDRVEIYSVKSIKDSIGTGSLPTPEKIIRKDASSSEEDTFYIAAIFEENAEES
jgi:hypothetical protein